MALIDTINRVLRRFWPDKKTTTTTTDTGSVPSMPTEMLRRFTAERERVRVVQVCREMYETDTRARRHCTTLAEDMVAGGFTVTVTEGARAEEAQAAAADLQERIKMGSRLDDWVRLSLRDGDSFLEVGVDEELQVAEVTRKPTLEMRRASDRSDKFPDPERAFWWGDRLWWGMEPPADVVWFAEWQIVHARWDHDEGRRYGSPLFSSGTGAWKRVKEGDMDIAVRRKTRAGMKYLHVVEGAQAGDLEAYKEENKDALGNPFAAVADFFSNKAGSISAIQGDAKLDAIGDVEYQIETWLMASPVPSALVGYGKDLNRDILEDKKEQYEDNLVQLRPWVEDEIIKPLVELQWLLMGIWPQGLKYQVVWKEKASISAADLKDAADAGLKLKALGLPLTVIWKIISRFLPGIDLETLMVAMQQQPDGDEAEGTPAAMARTLSNIQGMF